MSKQTNFKSGKLRRYYSKKNLILFISIMAFVGSILFMQIGSSVNERYAKAEPPVARYNEPETFSEFINQNSSDSRGGFNISQDFEQLPGFDIPVDLIENLPDSFGKENAYGQFPEIEEPVTAEDIIGEGNDDFVLPGGLRDIDTGIDRYKGEGRNDDIISGDNPITGSGSLGDFNKITGSTDTSSNTTLNERSDKARNLPTIDFIDLSAINFNFINLSNLKVTLETNFLIFLSVLAMPIVIMNKIVPNFLGKLDEFDSNKSNIESIFVLPKRNLSALKKKKERVTRLLIFKDHLEELIKRSKIRIERASPSHTIIIGYHELDKAFSEFSSLIRRKDITPLEHAKMHFETGEIDNDVLIQIVDLFYLTRFGHRELVKEDGYKFIENLDVLVIDKNKISDKLRQLEKEISESIDY